MATKLPVKKLNDGSTDYFPVSVLDSVFVNKEFTTKNAVGGLAKGATIPVNTSLASILTRMLVDEGVDFQSELDKKVDKQEGKDLSTNDFDDTYKAQLDNLSSNLDKKVDVEDGKGLSTNDFTDEAKSVIDNLDTNFVANTDTKYQFSDWVLTINDRDPETAMEEMWFDGHPTISSYKITQEGSLVKLVLNMTIERYTRSTSPEGEPLETTTVEEVVDEHTWFVNNNDKRIVTKSRYLLYHSMPLADVQLTRTASEVKTATALALDTKLPSATYEVVNKTTENNPYRQDADAGSDRYRCFIKFNKTQGMQNLKNFNAVKFRFCSNLYGSAGNAYNAAPGEKIYLNIFFKDGVSEGNYFSKNAITIEEITEYGGTGFDIDFIFLFDNIVIPEDCDMIYMSFENTVIKGSDYHNRRNLPVAFFENGGICEMSNNVSAFIRWANPYVELIKNQDKTKPLFNEVFDKSCSEAELKDKIATLWAALGGTVK